MYSIAKSTQSFLYHRNNATVRQLNAASISTNAALDFRNHFWEAFETRSQKHGRQCEYEAPSLPFQVQNNPSKYVEAANQLIKNAHKDLFKHFRMNASLRAMKRGDGILSDQYSLNDAAVQENTSLISYPCGREMTLIDLETERKAREDMYNHFWSAHCNRKDVAVRQNTRDAILPQAVYPDRNRSRVPLPTNLHDIHMEYFGFHPPNKRMAIAITETSPPFKIIDVNKAWIDLCGYSRKHAIGSTLKLLQGPETNVQAANRLVSSLLAEKKTSGSNSKEYETVLTNYRSDGKMFRNHIRVGVLKDADGEVVNFVGAFKRLDDDDEMII